MSAKTDVEAIHLIGDEVVRLLMLPEEKLENEAREGLQLITELARWRDSAFGPDPSAGMHFEVFTCGVDETRPLLYLWQIEDRHGQILYRYVGKSERGSRRPLTQVDSQLAEKTIASDLERSQEQATGFLPLRRG